MTIIELLGDKEKEMETATLTQRSGLSVKQELFCLEYLATGNASEAYRRAYSTGNMAPETIGRRAHDLVHSGKIKAKLEEIRGGAVDRAEYSLAQHLERLKDLSEQAEREGNYSAAVRAEELRGKASGFYVERVKVENDQALLDRITRALAPRNGC